MISAFERTEMIDRSLRQQMEVSDLKEANAIIHQLRQELRVSNQMVSKLRVDVLRDIRDMLDGMIKVNGRTTGL